MWQEPAWCKHRTSLACLVCEVWGSTGKILLCRQFYSYLPDKDLLWQWLQVKLTSLGDWEPLSCFLIHVSCSWKLRWDRGTMWILHWVSAQQGPPWVWKVCIGQLRVGGGGRFGGKYEMIICPFWASSTQGNFAVKKRKKEQKPQPSTPLVYVHPCVRICVQRVILEGCSVISHPPSPSRALLLLAYR